MMKPIRKYLVNKPHSQRLKHYLDRKIKSNSCKPNKVLKLIKLKKINATFRRMNIDIIQKVSHFLITKKTNIFGLRRPNKNLKKKTQNLHSWGTCKFGNDSNELVNVSAMQIQRHIRFFINFFLEILIDGGRGRSKGKG